MKPGDMVKFVDRYEKQRDRMFLVLRRDAQNMYKKYGDDSKWAKWHIVNLETGKVHTQIGRDLHVLENNV
jgi:hypothetical protein